MFGTVHGLFEMTSAAGAAPAVGAAWIAATAAFALHVVDEATHDFLAWYNPRAMRIRAALGGLPFPPTFRFGTWLAGLIAAAIVLAALTPAAYAGAPWLRPIALLVAAVHVVNGLVHLTGSVLARRLLPGVLSAPLLVVTGVWLGWVAAAW